MRRLSEPSTLTLMRTELLKLSTTRVPWVLGAGSIALAAGQGLQPVLRAGTNGAPSIGTSGATLAVIDAAGRGSLLALVIGVLVVTGEVRHGTITTTLLHAPQRSRLMWAKTLAAASTGLALGISSLMLVGGIGVVSAAIRPSLLNPDIALRALGLTLTYPLLAVLGVGIGTLLREHQSVAVLLPIAWLLGLEGLALSGLPQNAKVWGLTGVTDALQNSGALPRVLPMFVGAAALLGYALVLAGAGTRRITRADIT